MIVVGCCCILHGSSRLLQAIMSVRIKSCPDIRLVLVSAYGRESHWNAEVCKTGDRNLDEHAACMLLNLLRAMQQARFCGQLGNRITGFGRKL